MSLTTHLPPASRLPLSSPLLQDCPGPSFLPMMCCLMYALYSDYFRRPLLEPQVGEEGYVCRGREDE